MSDENAISNVKINGTTYSINDPSKASIEDISNLTNISNENNALLSGINSKLDGLLDKVGNSSSMDFYKCSEVIHAENSPGPTNNGIFSVSGCEGDYAGANGNYYLYNTETGRAAQYKHETNSFYIFVEQLQKTHWVLNNSLDLSTSNWPDMWPYRLFGSNTSEYGTLFENPFPEAGEYIWHISGPRDVENSANLKMRTSKNQIVVTPSNPVDPNSTWSGYKAILITDLDGKQYYTFEETPTEGLTYGEGFTPEIDAIYDEKALIKIEKLYLNE